MKSIRKIIPVMLIAIFALCMTGCAFLKTETPEAIVRTAKEYGIKEVDSRTDLVKITSKLNVEGSGYYIAKDNEEATKYYQSFFNARKNLPNVDVDDFRMIAVLEKGEVVVHTASVFSAHFLSEDDAKTVYEKYTAGISSSRIKKTIQGEKKLYSYTLQYYKSAVSTTIIGIYFEDKSVTLIQANYYKDEFNSFADHFCDKMGYISPMTIVED